MPATIANVHRRPSETVTTRIVGPGSGGSNLVERRGPTMHGSLPSYDPPSYDVRLGERENAGTDEKITTSDRVEPVSAALVCEGSACAESCSHS